MLHWQEHISISPNIRFGKPCIKGTRITVSDILGWLASGMSYEEITDDFPTITKKDIMAALAFATHQGENTKILVRAA
jgi:uncharacterized protein (DUF433 family)